MNKRVLAVFLTTTAFAVCLMGGGPSAKADLTLTLSEAGYAPLTIDQATVAADGGVETISIPGVASGFATLSGGTLQYTGTYGTFTNVGDTVSLGASSPTDAQLLANTLQVQNGATAGVLTATAEATGYTQPATPVLDLTSNISSTNVGNMLNGDNITFQSTLTSAGGNGTTSLLTLTAPNLGLSSPALPISTYSTPYTLTSVTTLTLSADASSQSNGQTNAYATPEPATMASAVVGLGLFAGVGALRRRSRRA